MPKTCPRCQQPFSCRPDAIHECGCTRLSLSADDLVRIRAYTEQQLGEYVCLCTNCLRELTGTPTEQQAT